MYLHTPEMVNIIYVLESDLCVATREMIFMPVLAKTVLEFKD